MSDYARHDDLGTVLRTFTSRVERLERSRSFQIPTVVTDPADLEDGDVWINTTSGTLKVRIGGVTKTVTVT